MWMTKQSGRVRTGEPSADTGVVTLSGGETAVYARGEKRSLPLYAPGGIDWRPCTGDTAMLLRLGDEGDRLCVAAVPCSCGDLQPGELRLHSRGASIYLHNDGRIEVTGQLLVNGTEVTG